MSVVVYQIETLTPAVVALAVSYPKGTQVQSVDADGRTLIVADAEKKVLAVWAVGTWLRADIT
jgi:hypothetical protein